MRDAGELRFGRFQLRRQQRRLLMDGAPVELGARAIDVLFALIEAEGAAVSKDDLLSRVWPGVAVEEHNLNVQVYALRKALGPDRELIRTIPRQGYCFTGEVAVATPPRDEVSPRASVRAPSTNIFSAIEALIGRHDEVRELLALQADARLLTLSGPGGIGKTVLALQVARTLAASFRGEIVVVELASLSNPVLVGSAAAGAIGLKVGGGEISPDVVARAIGSKPLLLLLDNCEHLIDAAAALAETLLHHCPNVSLLATSREALRIEGEAVYRVPALDLPPARAQAEEILQHGAVQLFIARVSALNVQLAASADNLQLVADICRRLDGIPLAIEFAAARAATLGLHEVAVRLNDRFGLLRGGRRTALPRHQMLRATLDWSYDLLSEPERRLLRRLAVFSAGCTIEGAVAVMGGDDAGAVIDGIASLVAKSLLTRDAAAAAGDRWRLLETTRAYALEKLAESNDAAEAARRQADFFCQLFSAAAPSALVQPPIEEMPRYLSELDNVRAALEWCFAPGGEVAIGVALTAGFVPGWMHAGLLIECREQTERALARLDPNGDLGEPMQMQLNLAFGLTSALTLGSSERAGPALDNALRLAERLGNVEVKLRTLWAIWVLNNNIGAWNATPAISEQFSRTAHRAGEEANILVAERIAGYTLHLGGQQREARPYIEHVLVRYSSPVAPRQMVWPQLDQRVLARALLGRVLWLEGHLDQAVAHARASLDDAEAMGSQLSICDALRVAVCPIAIMTGDLATAGREVPRLVDLAARCNAPFWRIVGRCLQGKLLIALGEFKAGVDMLRGELDGFEATGWDVGYPEFLGVLAEGLAGMDMVDDALDAVGRALARVERGAQRFYLPELMRIQGELLWRQNGDRVPAAEARFVAAIELAGRQGAPFWELRAAMSLARLRIAQRRRDDARQILAPAHAKFTEGLDTADVRAAAALLASLPAC
jgi:predicted ATPase/DNA-binding winged helix-turn-helix (wHTH) protein